MKNKEKAAWNMNIDPKKIPKTKKAKKAENYYWCLTRLLLEVRTEDFQFHFSCKY